MTPSLWLESIAADGARIAATPAAALGDSVPSCPGWTVRDLIVHTAGAHRWAMAFLRAGPESKERFTPDVADAPDGAALLDWSSAVVAELLRELRSHDPDAPARAFIGRTVAAFWMRRMTQETSIHRWDLQNALGAIDPISPEVGHDGITEITAMQIPMMTKRQGLPAALVGKSIHVHTTDTGGEWTLRLRADGVEVESGHAKADVAVRGPAADVDLLLWRRARPGTVELHGETDVLDGLLDLVVI